MSVIPLEVGVGYRRLDPDDLVLVDDPDLETVWNGAWTQLRKIQLGAVSGSHLHLFRAKSPYKYKEWAELGWGMRRANAGLKDKEEPAAQTALKVEHVQISGIVGGDALKPFTPNKYTRTLTALDGRKVPVDVYCVLDAFPTGSAAVDHAVKKQLAPGARGVKSRLQDLKEARDSLTRAIEIEEAKEQAEGGKG